METFLCDKCLKLFYNIAGPNDCPYCSSKYVIWVTYKERSKKETDSLLKKAVDGIQGKSQILPNYPMG